MKVTLGTQDHPGLKHSLHRTTIKQDVTIVAQDVPALLKQDVTIVTKNNISYPGLIRPQCV